MCSLPIKKQKLVSEHETVCGHSTTTYINPIVDKILALENELSLKLKNFDYGPPVDYVYNPLEYASELHALFLEKFCDIRSKKIMFLGMNPGPWGMAQTGIPFGENKIVKEWFQICGAVGHPDREHPSKRILGLECKKSEVSGKRFWGFFKELCGVPANFFRHSFVYNICPVALMTSTGVNVTPAELKNKNQKEKLLEICQESLYEILLLLKTDIIISIGRFAESRAKILCKKKNLTNIQLISIPHPSPRNFSCKDWPASVSKCLNEFDLMKYFVLNSSD